MICAANAGPFVRFEIHDAHAAIYLPSPRAFPARYVIDPEQCNRCGACVAVCPQQAIDLEAVPISHDFTVGSLVVATGFKPFDPKGSRYEAWA